MSKQFNHVRFDRKLHIGNPSFPCKPILYFVEEAMRFFVPRIYTEQLKSQVEIFPQFAFALGAASTLAADSAQDGGVLRQREFEEVVEFIEDYIEQFEDELKTREALEDDIDHGDAIAEFELSEEEDNFEAPASSLIWALKERFRDGNEFTTYTLSTGRVIGRLELVAAAVLLECEMSVDAYIAGDIDRLLHLVVDMKSCSDYTFASAEQFQRVQIEASLKGRRAHAGKPKQLAMSDIRANFDRWQSGEMIFKSDAEFARKMQATYPAIVSEASIKNACSRWRKQSRG